MVTWHVHRGKVTDWQEGVQMSSVDLTDSADLTEGGHWSG